MSYNPHVDTNGNCVNCGTGQLNFDGRSTGCACSRVADAEYEEEKRIIKLLRTELGPYLIWVEDTPYIKGIDLDGFIALIKGENSDNSNVRSIADNTVNGTEGENK